MKNQPSIALVAEGPAKEFPLAQLPRFLGRLGPVKSSSNRVASRVVNTLRAGFPVHVYEDLEPCPNLVLSVGSRLPAVVSELSASSLTWKGRVVLVCANNAGSSDLAELFRKGARVGSLGVVGFFDPPRFVGEGDPEAVRFARTLVAVKDDIFEIAKSSKTLYGSGVAIASSFLAPLAAAGVRCLRLAGMPLRDAMLIVEKTIAGSLRAYIKAGEKGWTGPLASNNVEAVQKQLEELHQTSPLLEQYFRQNALFALEIFSRESSQHSSKMARMLQEQHGTEYAHGKSPASD